MGPKYRDCYPGGLNVGLSASSDLAADSQAIDVQENIKTMERRLTTAEEKLQATTVVSQPLVTDEEGLPLTEIREELDDDGNVICEYY